MSDNSCYMESAYCEKLNKNITIDDAIEAYKNGEIAKHCEFKCPDKNCRINAQAKITCVCCFSDNCKTSAHFRNYPNTAHAETCIYSVYGKIVKQILKTERSNDGKDNHADINLLRIYTVKDIDPSAIIDEYSPAVEHDYMDDIKRSARRYAAEGRSSDEALRIAIESVPHSTRRLEAVVDSCELLNDKGRDDAWLKIPGRVQPASYRQVFRRIENLKDYFKTPYIMYGEARIYQYQSGYQAFFQNKIPDYAGDKQRITAICFFSNEDLDNFRFGKKMRHELESFAKSHDLCCLYMLGTHELRMLVLGGADEKSFVVISPNSLADVVIKKRCVK